CFLRAEGVSFCKYIHKLCQSSLRGAGNHFVADEFDVLLRASLKLHGDNMGGKQRKYVELVDRKSTRLNSSHGSISYAVFCLKKKTNENNVTTVAVVTTMFVTAGMNSFSLQRPTLFSSH